MRYIPPELSLQIQRKLKTIQTEGGLEVTCKDVTFCDFIGQGGTPEEVLVAAAEHASKEHGMMSFPPQWYVQMRRHIKAVQG
jgi:predicted small metal-binding protein